MPNNGNDWNRTSEGSGRYENEDRYNRRRENDYDDYYDRDRNYGGQGGDFGTAAHNRDRSMDRRSDYERRGSYGSGMSADRGGYAGDWNKNDDWNRGNDYNRSNDWNRGSDRNTGYSGPGSWGSDDRYRDERNYNNDRSWWNKTKDEVSSWFGDEDAERRRRMDESNGAYRGKGPKGYTRSDERIKEDINDRLSDDARVDASDIEVSVSGCEVTLTGTVQDRWQKRRAEDIAESISGVKNVENRVKVSSSADMGSSYGNMGTAGNVSNMSAAGNNRQISPAKTSG